MAKLSLDRVLRALVSFGLSQADAQIYIYLAQEGPAIARNIINGLKINERQVYRCLKRLQNKGIIIANDKQPFEFTILPFERVLELLTMEKREDAKALQASRDELISDFRADERKSNSRS